VIPICKFANLSHAYQSVNQSCCPSNLKPFAIESFCELLYLTFDSQLLWHVRHDLQFHTAVRCAAAVCCCQASADAVLFGKEDTFAHAAAASCSQISLCYACCQPSIDPASMFDALMMLKSILCMLQARRYV